MPRRGKRKKRKRETASSVTESFVSAIKKFGQTAVKCAELTHSLTAVKCADSNSFASALPERERKRNRKILKAPTAYELPLGAIVVSNTDGTVRPAAEGEIPIGVVVSRSHRIRNNKATFYASVAQDVERSVEAREVEGSHLPGAPVFEGDFKEVEKRAMHAMNYGMSPGRIEEMYGGGSRAKIYGSARIGKTAEVETAADSPSSEQAGIHRRQEWQRESSRPTWYNAKGTEGGGESRE